MASAFQGLMDALGSAGNNIFGIQGSGPGNLNALERMALSPEQRAAYAQQTQAAATPIDINDPNLAQKAAINPQVGEDVNRFINMQQTQALAPAMLSQIKSQYQQPAANGNSGSLPWQTQFSPAGAAQKSGQPQSETVGDKPINNPGNLRPVGATTGFRQFPSPESGVAALSGDLAQKLTGNSTALNGQKPTIRNIITAYSPPNENNTSALIQQASQRMQVDPDQPLSIKHLEPLTNVIMKQENPAIRSGGFSSMPLPQNGQNSGQPSQTELPEVTAARNSISQLQMDRLRNWNNPAKLADIDSAIATQNAKLLEFGVGPTGERELAKSSNTYSKNPQGNMVLPSQNQAESEQSPQQVRGGLAAGDGKPIVPQVKDSFFKPDPSGMPKYPEAKTETDVNQTKIAQADDAKSNSALTSQLSSLQNEQFRLKELTNIYKQVQSGTLMAQNPEFINKLIGWGVIKDPAEVKNVAGVQAALQSHVLQIIQQIKDTNANMGNAPTRTFGSEISSLQEKGEDPGAQPEALWNIIGQAKGIVDHHIDMVNGWDKIGGLGNRLANGNTLRPEDYARQFMLNHDIEDYKSKAQKEMGEFKGMSDNKSASSSPSNSRVTPSGRKYIVLP